MKRLILVALVVLCGIGGIAFNTHPASATITNLISFQGKLTNPDGTNVTDGNYSIRFRIYTSTAPTDATNSCSANSCKWEETQATVAVSGGLFQVDLGSTGGGSALPGGIDFNSGALYLGIKIGSDAEMAPRVQLTAAPQAFNSDMLDGLDSTNFVQLSGGNVNIGAGTVTSGAVNGVVIGSTIQPSAAGALTVKSNGANALGLDTGGGAAINIGGTNATSVAVGNATTNPSISFSGSGTFGTTSGAVSLNGDTTITGTKALTVNGGLTTLGGGLTFSGTAARTITGPGTGGLTINVTSGPLTLSTTTSGTLTIQGSSSGVVITSGANITLGAVDSTATQLILDSRNVSGETSAPAVTGVNGGSYYNSANNKFRCFENSVWKNCSNGGGDTFSTVVGPATTAATKAATGTILIAPLYISGQTTVNELRVSVITTVLGAAGDVGIYNAAGTLVLNAGSSSVTTAIGLKALAPVQTGVARILEPGQYYAAVTWNATTGSVSSAALPVAGMIKRVGTITGGGLVLPASLTLSSITAAANMPAITVNN